jgi:hypothetical protein
MEVRMPKVAIEKNELECWGEFADTSQIIEDAFRHEVAASDVEGDGDLDTLVG